MSARRAASPVVRVRGAVVWKALLAIAVGIGGVWAAARLGDAPPVDEPRETAKPVAIPAPAPTASAGAPAAASAPSTPPSDPFAGVDVKNNSVLRHIASIEEKTRSRLAAAPKRPPAPAADTAVRAGNAQPAQPREESADTRARPPAPVLAAPPAAAAPQSDAPRSTAVPGTVPTTDPPARPPVESPPSTTAERAVKGPVATLPTVVAPPTTTLAAARPDPAPPAPAVAAPLRVINRTVPEYPGEAIRAGVRSGRVVARLSIDADGRVTATQLLSASPTGYFERESRRALSTWRYDPPGQPTTADVELIFTRE